MELQSQLLQYVMTGLTTGAIYALLAIGFVAIYNVTGVINFAQGENAMLGALLMVTLHSQFELAVPLAFILTVAIVGLIGATVYRLALRPAQNASPTTMIIITIGASIVIRGLALVMWGTDSYALTAFTAGQPIRVAGAVVQLQSLWVLGTTLVCVAGLYLFFQHTKLGRAVRACAVNRLAARLMGINHDRMAAFSFLLGAALGAVAGAVIAPITYATYDMGTMLGLKGFVAAMMGGLTSLPGAVAGGLLLGILEATGAGLISSGAKNAIALTVLLVILFFRSGGYLRDRWYSYEGL